jgi:2-hydroxychromene-2-carboxylate isomerase
MRIEALAQKAQRRIVWRPFLLGPVFKAQGWNDSPFNIYPAKGRYMWRDLERICGGLGIGLRKPSVFPRNSLLPARVACAFDGEPWLPEFVRRVYAANFAQDREISDAAVIGAILQSIGQPLTRMAEAQSSAVKEKLRASTERAAALGIFGAPSFVAEGELFWGNDRLEAALAWPS